MSIEEIYKLYINHYLVDTDTRKIRKNTIFFALTGENFNGNTFALHALKKGAKYAIVDEKREGYINNENIILVKDVLTCLQELAKYHIKNLKIPIIALTGSNGKTTTKELINSVLSLKYNTTATKGNLNNHIGVPLTILSMNTHTEIGIVEMGANHPKEIGFLSEIAQPNYGYITNFGKAHLEGFGSLEGVVKAKSELYDYLITNNQSIFVNPNDSIQLKKTENSNRFVFDKNIKYETVNPFVCVTYNNTSIKTNLIGKYNYDNIACAITIGLHFNIAIETIKTAIESYIPTNNRSQIITTKTNKIILDAYNANPSSMVVALENLNLLKADRKLIILGDMFELGATSNKEHQEIVNLATLLKFDKVLLVGENFYKTNTTHLKFKTLKEIKTYLTNNNYQHTSILIKGSRGMTLESLVDYIN